MDSLSAWSAKQNKDGAWLQIDAGRLVTVRGVVTQGRANWDQWVTKYSVQTSTDGSTWTQAQRFNNGNTNRNTKVQHELSKPVRARYVRFVVHAWHGHCSMRAGLRTCAGEPCFVNHPQLRHDLRSP